MLDKRFFKRKKNSQIVTRFFSRGTNMSPRYTHGHDALEKVQNGNRILECSIAVIIQVMKKSFAVTKTRLSACDFHYFHEI